MRITKEVKMKDLNKWLSMEEEMNNEYYEAEEALQEVNDILDLETGEQL